MKEKKITLRGGIFATKFTKDLKTAHLTNQTFDPFRVELTFANLLKHFFFLGSNFCENGQKSMRHERIAILLPT